MIATTRNAGDVLAATLFWPAFEFCNPAGMLPKLNVVTVNHSLGAFLRSVVVIANDIDGLDEITIAANQVCSIVRHGRSLKRCQRLHLRGARLWSILLTFKNLMKLKSFRTPQKVSEIGLSGPRPGTLSCHASW
jgi:hypothetical protein